MRRSPRLTARTRPEPKRAVPRRARRLMPAPEAGRLMLSGVDWAVVASDPTTGRPETPDSVLVRAGSDTDRLSAPALAGWAATVMPLSVPSSDVADEVAVPVTLAASAQ